MVDTAVMTAAMVEVRVVDTTATTAALEVSHRRRAEMETSVH